MCRPEVYRDIPGKFHDDDDDDDSNWGGRIKPLLKIFNELKSLTEVGNFTLIEDLQRM